MADKSFDVVIVGGGNKALIAAMYLTMYAKLEVGIFEERHKLGGGWCQEEPTPGFLGNPCSMAMTAQYHIPTFWDFPEWETYGVKMAYTAHLARNFAPTGNWCVIDNIPSQSGRFRPIAELAHHKVPGIESLYCTGSAWSPYGAAHSMQGYNCYKVMAEDLHLPKPLAVDGRPF